MRPLESAVATTRRNLRFLLTLSGVLALLTAGVGALLFILGKTRPDVTLTFSEFGEYLAVLGALHLGLYAGLYWQFSRLSKRPRSLLPSAPVAPSPEPVERT